MLSCNIDQFGRMARFVTGLIMFFTGSVMFVANVPGYDFWSRVFQGGLTLLGIFVLFEGVMGWCALRALGMKTKF